jgi:hypothetical protein
MWQFPSMVGHERSQAFAKATVGRQRTQSGGFVLLVLFCGKNSGPWRTWCPLREETSPAGLRLGGGWWPFPAFPISRFTDFLLARSIVCRSSAEAHTGNQPFP